MIPGEHSPSILFCSSRRLSIMNGLIKRLAHGADVPQKGMMCVIELIEVRDWC